MALAVELPQALIQEEANLSPNSNFLCDPFVVGIRICACFAGTSEKSSARRQLPKVKLIVGKSVFLHKSKQNQKSSLEWQPFSSNGFSLIILWPVNCLIDVYDL